MRRRNLRSVVFSVARCAPVGFLLAVMLLASLPATTAEGVWKESAQEEWDEKQDASVTRIYRVFDLHPELDLEFQWRSDDRDAPYPPGGIVEGKGKLTWRRKGAPAYDAAAVVSEYSGEMKSGRPDGEGRLVRRAGMVYVGAWKNGLMHGRGAIKFENGDDYGGDFSAGLMHGQGRYAAADGSVYVGEFKNGQRDGTGMLTTADGRSYKSAWRAGKEIERAPTDPASGGADRPGGSRVGRSAGGLSVRMLVDRRKNQEFLAAEESFPYYVYEAENDPGIMRVQLASPEIMSAWKGDATLRVVNAASGHIEDLAQFAPVFLVADIDNDGARAARVQTAYLSVETSATDLQPFLQISGSFGDTFCGTVPYDPTIKFTNYGWGPARNARLSYSFGANSSPTREFAVNLNTFDVTKTASLVDGLRQSKVDIDKMRRSKFKCPSLAELPACLRRIEASGILGDLAGRVFNERDEVFTKVAGRIDYEWTESNGRNSTRSSALTIDIPLFRIEVEQAECGAPGAVEHAGRTIELPLDKRNYRIPVNWRGELAPRENKRFAFSIVSAKSSHHVFRLVLELADGTMLASRAVDLTYFKPRLPPKAQ